MNKFFKNWPFRGMARKLGFLLLVLLVISITSCGGPLARTSWEAQRSGGHILTLDFSTNTVKYLLNGQTTGEGSYTLSGNKFTIIWTSGQASGQREGTIAGNALIYNGITFTKVR